MQRNGKMNHTCRETVERNGYAKNKKYTKTNHSSKSRETRNREERREKHEHDEKYVYVRMKIHKRNIRKQKEREGGHFNVVPPPLRSLQEPSSSARYGRRPPLSSKKNTRE